MNKAPNGEGPPSAQQLSSSRRLTWNSVGQFSSREWINEGDHLYASAKAVRATWVVKRNRLRRRVATQRPAAPGRGVWADLEGLPKASVLLLGYSAEMYLKAGLAKAYHGCSETMFDRDVRRRFGHDLIDIAKEIALFLSAEDERDLIYLKEMVLFGARYPIKERSEGTYLRQRTERLWQVWNKSEFTRLRQLVLTIRKQVSLIDSDNDDAAHFQAHQLDSDGYLASRYGGHKPARITYRLSSEQRATGEIGLDDMYRVVEAETLIEILRIWDHALILEDTDQKTVVRQCPSRGPV